MTSDLEPSIPGWASTEDTDIETPGQITLSAHALEFQGESLFLAIPLSRLQIRAAGSQDFMLDDPEQSEMSLRFSDPALIDALQNRRYPQLRSQIKSIRQQTSGRRNVRLSVVVLAAVAGISLLGWIGFNLAVAIAVSHITPSDELELSRKFLSELEKTVPLNENRLLAQQLEPIRKALAHGFPPNPYHFSFHVIQSETPNAFALPGGLIYVHEGLLKLLQTPEELCGILAHEAAHVIHRHGIKQLVKTLGPARLLQGLLGNTELLQAVSLSSLILIHQERSRAFENQADETGWRILNRANIDPRGMLSALEKLAQCDPDRPSNAPMRALMSHPPTSDRIRRLQQLCSQMPRQTGFMQWDDYRLPLSP